MTVKDMFVVFDEKTRFKLYKKDYDGRIYFIFDNVLIYAELWMLDLYVVKAYAGNNGVIECVCE